MTQFLAPYCGCIYRTSLGEKKPESCEEHGKPFVNAKSARRSDPRVGTLASRKPRKRSSEPKRDWSLAIAKKEEEGDRCRVCGAPGTECAHILGRRHDQPISPGSRTLLVLPDRIVPLCPVHHREYDSHSLDLLGFLRAPEQAQAVLDAGGIESARRRLAPSAYVESLAS